MVKKYLKIVLAFTIMQTSCSDKQITCTLKGKVVGVTSDTIMLLKATDDIRFTQIFIPIKDSLFEYKLTIPKTEAYQMIFQDDFYKGGMRPIIFFPVQGEINCTLFSSRYTEKNSITGSLNAEYRKFHKNLKECTSSLYKPIFDSLSVLRARDEYYDEEIKKLSHQLESEKNEETKSKIYKKLDEAEITGTGLSQKAKYYRMKYDSINKELLKLRYKYIEDNINPLSYYLMFQDLNGISYMPKEIDIIKKSYNKFSQKLPDHPYTQLIGEMIKSFETIKIGGSFIDFSVPDLKGNNFKLSEVIKDKYALIDLWASWCGPCIKASRAMIPVYEEFKDKGFTICGVAAEINNTDQLIKRLEKEKFPWINLVELNHKNKIWYKYGIQNSGGKTFLVDPKGKILAIAPSADEVREILSKMLK